jgi:asparagine synthase (glutamine-hydrolysing)
VIEIAEGIPFNELTGYEVNRLYALKGQIIRRGIKQVIGVEMPIFPKRRFQHGALPPNKLRELVPDKEGFFRGKLAQQYLANPECGLRSAESL